jgi:hypothetical protein
VTTYPLSAFPVEGFVSAWVHSEESEKEDTVMRYEIVSKLALVRGAALALALILPLADGLRAQEHHDHMHMEAHSAHTEHLSQAPIGVMGEHTHERGRFMLSYRYMFMRMDGIKDGDDKVSASSVLSRFMVAPLHMNMQMHMVGAMFALTDKINLMAMVPYVQISMEHLMRNGEKMTEETSGLGDIKLSGLCKFAEVVSGRTHHAFILNMGVSLPTGSIKKRGAAHASHDDQMHMMGDSHDDMGGDMGGDGSARLSYPMQLGSGTVDLLPGLTYTGSQGAWHWGSQAMGTIRLGENDNDYRLGNRFAFTTWGARNLSEWVSASLRLNLEVWGNIHGRDPQIDPTVSPMADPKRQAGRRLSALFGLNFYTTKGPRLLRGHKFGVEGGFPLYEHLDGPALETDFVLTAGWQYAFSL